MRKKLILLPVAGALFYVGLSASSTGPGPSYGDRTGATAGTLGCGSGCHATSATPSTVLTLDLYDATGTTKITTGYVGGTSYKIRITGTNTGSTTLKRFGFQASVVKTSSTSTNEGTLTAPTGTHLGTYGANNIHIVEHSSPLSPSSGTGGSGTVYTVPDIPWTAPVAGTGSVTIFTALNAVNFDGNASSLDLWNNTSLVVPEASAGVSPISGTLTVCTGATTALTDATAGGTWSSSATGVATVGTSGMVTGVTPGTAIITYNDGGSGNATATVSVITSTPAAITGPKVVCVGTHIILSDAVAGGVWSSSNTSLATAGSSTGMISGTGIGVATIQYAITNSCGSGSVTYTVTVKALGGTCVSGVNTIGDPLQAELSVMPNPNWGSFSLNLSSENNELAYVTITNVVGAKVKEFTMVTNKKQEVKLENAIPGLYFISATTLQGRFAAKVVVQ